MIKIKMKRTIINGFTDDRLDSDKEYELPIDQAKAFVPRYADYVGEPPAEDEVPDGKEAQLDELTVKELKTLSEELGVEITATRKSDMIVEIKAVMDNLEGDTDDEADSEGDNTDEQDDRERE